jgi:hypothetical protein
MQSVGTKIYRRLIHTYHIFPRHRSRVLKMFRNLSMVRCMKHRCGYFLVLLLFSLVSFSNIITMINTHYLFDLFW